MRDHFNANYFEPQKVVPDLPPGEDRRRSPFEQASIDLERAIDTLVELLSELNQRLSPVRAVRNEKSSSPGGAIENASPAVTTILVHTQRIKDMHMHVATLLGELEV